MISIDICDGAKTHCDVAADQIPAFLGRRKGRASDDSVLWMDLSAPTEDDWRVLETHFEFHPLAMEDARQQNQRAKVDVYPGYLFLSIKAWVGTDIDENGTQEIDIFLGPNYLITIHDQDNAAILETRQRLERNPQHLNNQAGHLLYLIIDAVVDDYFPAMDALDEEIDGIETIVYESDASTIDIKPALRLKKRLLLLRQAISPLRDLLNQLLRIDDPALIAPSLRIFYQDVYDHTLRLVEQIDLHRDILGSVMEASMAQTSNRLNQVMKTMTGISTILMTDALIAGIYGMNFKNIPELNWPLGYFLSLGTMAVLSLALAVFFKKIRWF
jgi:magnesium transporter